MDENLLAAIGITVGGIAVIALAVFLYVRTPAETVIQETSSRVPRESSGCLGLVFGIALTIGIPLGILYFLVRFVKWAWAD